MTPQEHSLLFYGLLCTAFLLARIPYFGKSLRVVNTLFHEAGHAFMALAFSGKVLRMELFPDLSGTTKTATGSSLARFAVAVSGYPFASASAWILLFLIYHNQETVVLWILGILAMLALLFFVRNTFGVIWLLLFLALHSFTIIYAETTIKYAIALIFTMLLTSESVYSAFVILILSFRSPKAAGDANNLRELTGVPELIWGALFVAFALFILWNSLNSFFPPVKEILG